MNSILEASRIGKHRGIVGRINPLARFVSGFGLVLSVAWANPEPVLPFACILVSAGLWIAAAGARLTLLVRLAGYFLAVLLPFLVIYLLIPGLYPEYSVLQASEKPGNAFIMVLLKMLVGFIVLSVTVISVGADHLGKVVERLPLPRLVRLILVQMIVQTIVLGQESDRIRKAIFVRRYGTDRRTTWRLIQSLPAVWLERQFYKAYRLSQAMEVRLYIDRELGLEPYRMKGAEITVLLLVGLILATSLYFRLRVF